MQALLEQFKMNDFMRRREGEGSQLNVTLMLFWEISTRQF